MENKKFLKVVMPLEVTKMMLNTLQKVFTGNQFNKMLEHQEQMVKYLEIEYNNYDETEQVLQAFIPPILPEKQPEDKPVPTFVQISSALQTPSLGAPLPPRKSENQASSGAWKREKNISNKGSVNERTFPRKSSAANSILDSSENNKNSQPNSKRQHNHKKRSSNIEEKFLKNQSINEKRMSKRVSQMEKKEVSVKFESGNL